MGEAQSHLDWSRGPEGRVTPIDHAFFCPQDSESHYGTSRLSSPPEHHKGERLCFLFST
jgi:hypothetical protein